MSAMASRSHSLLTSLQTIIKTYKPTWRTLFLSLLLIFCLAISGYYPLFLISIPLLLAAFILILNFDLRRTPQAAGFALERHHSNQFTLGQPHPIEIVVENLTDQAIDVEVWDVVPATFTILHTAHGRFPQWLTRLKPYGGVKFTYSVRPTRRGDHEFGQLTLRWTSVLGLFMRQATYPIQTSVKVYPNLLQIQQYEQLARRGRQIQMGLRLSNLFGSGNEFEQLREYVPDDDYRRISWKATARQGKPITIDYSPERSQNIILTIDVSRQMRTRPLGMARTTRLDLIINAVLLFSYVALKQGDRVGIITFAKQVVKYVPPRSGSGQLMYLLEALYNIEPEPSEPNYANALRYLQTQRQRRSLIVLLTDPSREEAIEILVPHLGAFYPHHLPLCVTLSDPNVISAAQRAPYSMMAIQERALAEEILDERQMWRSLLEQRGVMTMDIPAYHLTAALLNKYLEIKGQTRI